MSENKYNLDPALTAEFIEESLEFIDKAAGLMVSIASAPESRQEIDAVFRIVHSIKGNAAFFNLLKVKSLAHSIEDLFDAVREGALRFSDKVVETAMTGVNELRLMLERVKAGRQEVENEAAYGGLIEAIQKTAKGSVQAAPGAAPAAEAGKPSAPGLAQDQAKKTMRIAEDSIDKFLDFVGDLVIVGEMYDHIQKRLIQECGTSRAVMDFKKNNDSFNTLSLNLQKSIFEIRKVPINALLARTPLIIHEIAQARDKKVTIAIKGQEVLVDKSLIEALDAPFMHMLRNCVDHGIEPPEKRMRTGKKAEGSVSIAVTEDEEKIRLVIEDDGAGIDKEAVRAKAVSQRLMSAEEAARLSEQELFQLIFLSGFSTASQVTDISGRGVGMDVVKKNVEAAGGTIEIDSAPGVGTRFTILVPKSITVKIIEGVLVSVRQQRFVLPLKSVGESFELRPEMVTRLPDGRSCVKRHDVVYPLVRLCELLAMGGAEGGQGNEIGIMVFQGRTSMVLVVDEILGLQQVVVKKIEGASLGSEVIAGGAILGDEKVAIVLDTEKLHR